MCFDVFAIQDSGSGNTSSIPSHLDEMDLIVTIASDNSSYFIKALLGNSGVLLSFFEVVNVLEIPIERKDGLLYVHFKNNDDPYLFDFGESRMIGNDMQSTLNPDQIVFVGEGEEYATPEFFERFGILLDYSKKDLTVTLSTVQKSPREIRIIREKSLKNNLKNKSARVIQYDTLYTNGNVPYQLNAIDYNIGFSNFSKKKSTAFISAGSRHVVLGGSLNMAYNYRTSGDQESFLDNFSFNWRNGYDTKIIKRLEIGELSNSGISGTGVSGRRYGIRMSNRHANKRDYREREINGYISPNTPIELYCGKELIDYQYSDNTGFYSFLYQPTNTTSFIVLKYIDEEGNPIEQYDNLGLLQRQNDKNELTYESSFGVSKNSLGGAAVLNYGITRTITAFAGIQHATAFQDDRTTTIPFSGIYTSFFDNNLSVNATYQHNAFFNSDFRISTNKLGNLRGRYTHYADNNITPINQNRGEEFVLGYQKRFNVFESGSLFLDVQKELIKLDGYRSTTLLGLKLDVSRFRFSYLNTINTNTPEAGFTSRKSYSQFGVTYNAQKGIKVDFQYVDDFENKNSRQGTLNINYRPKQNIAVQFSTNYSPARNDINATLSLRYDLSSVLIKNNISYSKSGFINTNFVSGSYIPGKGGRGTLKSNAETGGTGVLLIPFLDKNNNGLKDTEESLVKRLKIEVDGSNQIEKLGDGSIYIHNMTGGTVAGIELNQEDVQNIYHQLEYKNLGVEVQEAVYKTIYVPFKEVGEIEGVVHFKKGNDRPHEVAIYTLNNTKVATTRVESDGYFNYLGLLPGKYYLKIDKDNENTDHTITSFELLPDSVDGAYKGNINVKYN